MNFLNMLETRPFPNFEILNKTCLTNSSVARVSLKNLGAVPLAPIKSTNLSIVLILYFS